MRRKQVQEIKHCIKEETICKTEVEINTVYIRIYKQEEKYLRKFSMNKE